MAVAVGVDLGTTNTVVAAVREGVVSTLGDAAGERLLPSVVSFHPSGSVWVGRTALDRRLIDPRNTIFSVKRLIGRPWTAPEVQGSLAKFPFELCEGPKGATAVAARGEIFSLPEISAFVLRQARALAEAALGEPVDHAVITVPANFNDLQRAATKAAARLANLEVLRILNEPTAAALAYGPAGKAQERIAVYDLGGGTFDVTLLDLAGNVFEVLATAGDSALGGDDIDDLLADRMADDLLKSHRFDAKAHPAAWGRLRILAERLKRELSRSEEHTITADDLVPGDRGAIVTWRFRMTRPELEWASLPIVERSFSVCEHALGAAGLAAANVDRVILVGGSTRMPMVARKVHQFFGRPPVVTINPDEVVALGAAIQAGLLDRRRPRGSQAAMHPRIAQESVVAALPDEERGAFEVPDLPLVRPQRASGSRPGGPPGAEPSRAEAPLEPAPRIDPGAIGSSLEFLPGRAASTLVFEPPPAPQEVPPVPAAPPPRRGPPPPPPRRAPPSSEAESRVLLPRPPPLPPKPPPAPASAEPARPPAGPAAATPRQALSAAVSAEPAQPPAGPAATTPRQAPLLIDVTPLSLRVETVGGFSDLLIDANTPVPCDRTRTFATAADRQATVRVRVAQGENQRFDADTFLGELELSGLAPRPRGETQIAVTFEIDADGILNVCAKDVASGQETAARMQLVGAQTDPADVDRMRARQLAHPVASLDSSAAFTKDPGAGARRPDKGRSGGR